MINAGMDIDWPRRIRSLNSCLLFAALLLAGAGLTGLFAQPGAGVVRFSQLQTMVLVAGALWLIAAFLFSRWRRLQIAGAMVVLLVIAALSFVVYQLPAYALAFLPLAALPVALAVLLLNRAWVFISAAITAFALVATVELIVPLARPSTLALPLSQTELGLAVAAVSLLLVALILSPIRLANSALLDQLQQGREARTRLEQAVRDAEIARDEARETQERQRRHLDTLVQHIQDGVVGVSSTGQLVRANRVARELWAEVAGGDLIDLPLDQVQSALVGPKETFQYTQVIDLPPAGLDPEASYTHVLLDLRERARLARMRGELLGLLADEMRNPLTSMVTALDLTLGNKQLPEDVDRVLIVARQSGQRLLELVTTLLEISEIEENPDALRRSATPLSRVIEAGIVQMSPLAQHGAVTVAVEHAGDSVVSMDADRVQRAFIYLLEHALRQSPRYSTVQVRTERQEGSVIIRIADQGAGLSSQQSESIFLQRAGGDDRGMPALGLTFSKLVIEAHGGRVWADSNGSQGSTYGFSLPAERAVTTKEV